ncbi:MAG: terminase family protein [Pirellulaceae bacterium]
MRKAKANSPQQNLAEVIRRIATPATFAAWSSRGRWQMAPHLRLIDQALMDMLRGIGPRLLVVEAPPRHGKSELISRHLPAWFLGRYPERRVMLASYEAHLARSWGRKARQLLQDHGPTMFGVRLSPNRRAASEWELAEHGGGMVTAGAGGALTGRGADLLIIDDPIKNAEQALSQKMRDKIWDWWQSTASTRLEPGGCAVVMMTRWHTDDLVGKLLRQAARDGEATRRLSLPALAVENDPLGRSPGEPLWPRRWPREALARRRLSVEARWWQAMYQQRPSRHGWMEWPDDHFGPHLWADSWPDSFELAAAACDPSKGADSKRGDYFAVVVAGLSGQVTWVDALLLRSGSISEIVGRSLDLVHRYPIDQFGIESNAFQHLLEPEFNRQCRERRMPPLPIRMLHNHQNKRMIRIPRLGPYLARRELRFRDCEGCRLLVRQLEEFPLAEHDDGPDALEMALRLLKWMREQPNEPPPEVRIGT